MIIEKSVYATLFVVCFLPWCGYGNVMAPWKGPMERSHESVLTKWYLLDASVRDLFNSRFANNFYRALQNDTTVLRAISEPCQKIIPEMVDGLRHLKEWPIKMVDASGRIPSGLLSGTTADLGDYDQCVDINVQSEKVVLQGQYCLVNIRPALPEKPKRVLSSFKTIEPLFDMKTNNYFVDELRKFAPKYYDIPVTIGVCVPSVCTLSDLQTIISSLLSKVGLTAVVNRCEIKEAWSVDNAQIAVLSVIVLIVIFCFLGTAADDCPDQDILDNPSTLKKVLLSFSLRRNFRRLFATEQKAHPELAFLNGFRFLNINWIVLGHTYLLTNYEALQSSKNILKWMENVPFQFVNAGALTVDTFNLISSFLLTYFTLKKIDESGPGILNIPLIIFHRVYRLLPPLLLVMGLAVLSPLAGSGPLFHDVLDFHAKNCRENWWQNLLFIQNLPIFRQKCLFHSWFVAVDFQIFVLSLIFVYISLRSMKYAAIFNISVALLSIAATAWITYLKGFRPFPTMNDLNFETLSEFALFSHTQTFAHATSGCIGMVLGVYLARRKRMVYSRTMLAAGWTVTIVLFAILAYFPVIWNSGVEPTQFETLAFSSLCRVFWALINAWIIFVCYTGSFRMLSDFLSWQAIVPFSRLSYLVYLVHPLVIYVIYANVRMNILTANLFVLLDYIGFLVLSYLLAFFANIIVESPASQLEKVMMKFFYSRRSSSTKEIKGQAKKVR